MQAIYLIKKISLFLLVILCCTTLIAAPSPASSTPAAMAEQPTATQVLTPDPPAIRAQGYMLMDADSGQILAQKNIHTPMPPASLTKMMTLYVSWNALKNGQIALNDNVLISKKAWSTGGSRMFIRVNRRVPVKQLIQGIIVASGNDACVALAEHVAGTTSVFVQLMNQSAQYLGMNNTHYMNVTGLPTAEHYSTPYDIALLARALINQYPEYYHFFKQKWFRYNGIKQPNRNRLLWRDSTIDGLKTGHTKRAGYCLVASAKRDNMRLIAVTMGAPTDEARANDDQALLNYGFRFYKTHRLFTAATPIVQTRVWYGAQATVSLGVAQDFYITVPQQQYRHIQTKTTLDPIIKAPITQGEVYGKITLLLHGKEIATAPLVALHDDEVGSLWDRIKDATVLWLKKW